MGEWRNVLKEIGDALDARRTIYVQDHGFVVPGSEPPSRKQELEDERQRTARPPAGSRERTTRRQRTALGATGALAPVRCDDLCTYYQEELARAQEAYPSLRQLHDPLGMWLLVESSILKGLSKHAIFLVGVPFVQGAFPRAWGFWASPEGVEWLGPRHTNMPDGSVCAFVPQKGEWEVGNPLVKLLDLYTEWALRHLYLDVFKRWPGPQYSPHAYYRKMEFQPNELCSCHNDKLYGECCKALDDLRPFKELAVEFLKQSRTGLLREPPAQVLDFMGGCRSTPPTLLELRIPDPLIT